MIMKYKLQCDLPVSIICSVQSHRETKILPFTAGKNFWRFNFEIKATTTADEHQK